ncbi:MAG: YqgE/AlgH family protein [Vicingaceae bacterium]
MDFNPFKRKISELNTLEPQKGNLLVAEPFMQDFNFMRSVVLLVENNEDGAVGFILNKAEGMQVKDVIADFPDFDAPLYLGGPVETQSLFFLHTKGDLINDSVKIKDGLYWNGNLEQVKAMIEQKLVQPNEIKFFLGYAGWDKVQLEEELKLNSWLIKESSPEIIFNRGNELWKEVIANSPKEISVMANFPLDPGMN